MKLKQKQKELKEVYKKELSKKWGTDQKMVDYCARTTAYIVEHDSGLYAIERPNIKKDFCFGHGQNGITTEEDQDRAFNNADHARTNEDYFIRENLSGIEDTVKALEKAKEDLGKNWATGSYPKFVIVVYDAQYYGQPEGCRLKGWSITPTFQREITKGKIASLDFIDKLLEGYAQVKEDFIKRLNTYLKRYGLTKIHSWTYLVD